jgi:hypothetical protein
MHVASLYLYAISVRQEHGGHSVVLVIALATAPPPWYESGTWGSVSFAVGIITLVTGFAFYRIGGPRALIEYTMPAPVALMSSQRTAVPELQVALRGDVLADPYLVQLKVTLSRRDIKSSDFDKGKPLVFDLGVPVIEILASDAADDEPVSHDGHRVLVTPRLMRRRSELAIGILTEGKPQLSCERHPFAEVIVRQGSGRERESLWLRVPAILIVVLLTIWVLSNPLSAGNSVHRLGDYVLIPFALLLGGGAGIVWADRRRLPRRR